MQILLPGVQSTGKTRLEWPAVITVSIDYCPARTAPAPGASSVIAQPNQSASWEANKQLLIGIGVFSGLIATGFSLIGVWMVLPFAGLEFTALGGALYIVCRKLNLRHILHFSGDVLVIEKGIRFPQQVWRLPKQHCYLSVERKRHPWDPIRINICCNRDGHSENIPIGEFLNQEDSAQLLTVLRQHGLPVRNDSSHITTAA